MAEGKNVFLVKIGGGLIAPKDWPEETIDGKVVSRLVGEIKASGVRVVIAVGQGNFAHNAVKKFGISDPESVEKVRVSARKPGNIVTEELNSQGVPAQLVEPNKIYCSDGPVLVKDESNKIIEILELGRIPVVYGDVIDDKRKGWVIFSGEKNLEIILGQLQKCGWNVGQVIQTSCEEGVLDSFGKVVPEINEENWDEIKKDVGGAIGVDVTGGMLHKVEESLEIARKYHVKTMIVSGKIEGRLEELLKTGSVFGTKVS
jgi:isopentenyl phosphate kinase